MPFDTQTDEYLQSLISSWDTERRKMFGGTCYLLNGNMLCGVNKSLFIMRFDKESGDRILEHSAAAYFDMTGRPMTGWLQVDPDKTDEKTLREWLQTSHAFVSGLPQKNRKRKNKAPHYP
jgi:TfoX/Sxy family transcriptional regulator of competence genes